MVNEGEIDAPVSLVGISWWKSNYIMTKIITLDSREKNTKERWNCMDVLLSCTSGFGDLPYIVKLYSGWQSYWFYYRVRETLNLGYHSSLLLSISLIWNLNPPLMRYTRIIHTGDLISIMQMSLCNVYSCRAIFFSAPLVVDQHFV